MYPISIFYPNLSLTKRFIVVSIIYININLWKIDIYQSKRFQSDSVTHISDIEINISRDMLSCFDNNFNIRSRDTSQLEWTGKRKSNFVFTLLITRLICYLNHRNYRQQRNIMKRTTRIYFTENDCKDIYNRHVYNRTYNNVTLKIYIGNSIYLSRSVYIYIYILLRASSWKAHYFKLRQTCRKKKRNLTRVCGECERMTCGFAHTRNCSVKYRRHTNNHVDDALPIVYKATTNVENIIELKIMAL